MTGERSGCTYLVRDPEYVGNDFIPGQLCGHMPVVELTDPITGETYRNCTRHWGNAAQAYVKVHSWLIKHLVAVN